MKNSKYFGKTFDNGWKCTKVYLAANYCGGTKHNAYRYVLSRITSDGKCDKIIAVSGPTMKRIADGTTTVETVSENKRNFKNIANETLYKFIG